MSEAPVHRLKTWPGPFAESLSGLKPFEVRYDDRGYGVGHRLVLQEYEPGADAFSGREIDVTVTYISRGPDWGLPVGLCVMGVRPTVLRRPRARRRK